MSSTPLLPPAEELEPERRPTAELGPQSAARASAVASGDVAMLRMRWFWGAAYMCSMGASGMSTIGLSSTLVRLAVRCGTVEGDIADVFLIRGCGALLGAMLSGRVLFAPETSPYAIWPWKHAGNRVLVTALCGLAAVQTGLTYVNAVWSLKVMWFLGGICAALIDSGVQIMTQRVHGVLAGGWLAANIAAQGFFSAGVPVVALSVNGKLDPEFFVFTVIALVAAALVAATPHPRAHRARLPPRGLPSPRPGAHHRKRSSDDGEGGEEAAAATDAPAAAEGDALPPSPPGEDGAAAPTTRERSRSPSLQRTRSQRSASTAGDDTCCVPPQAPQYTLEVIFMLVITCLTGSFSDMSSFVENFALESGLVRQPARRAAYALLLLWGCIVVGRCSAVLDAAYALDLKLSPVAFARTACAMALSLAGASLLLDSAYVATEGDGAQDVDDAGGHVSDGARRCFWSAIVLYGLGNGPCVGYIYQLVNRIMAPTPEGISIVTLGLNLGAAVGPYTTSLLWSTGLMAFPLVVLVLAVAPLMLLGLAAFLVGDLSGDTRNGLCQNGDKAEHDHYVLIGGEDGDDDDDGDEDDAAVPKALDRDLERAVTTEERAPAGDGTPATTRPAAAGGGGADDRDAPPPPPSTPPPPRADSSDDDDDAPAG